MLFGFDFDRISKAPIGIDENHCMDETHCFSMNSATLLVHFFVKMVVFEMPLQIRCMCTVSIATSATSATMADGRWPMDPMDPMDVHIDMYNYITCIHV